MATGIGTAFFVGNSGRGYIKDLFFTDTANTLLTWDGGSGAAATSPDNYEAPEDLTLTHIILVAATGQTRTQVNINGVPTGNMLRNSEHIPSATIIGTPFLGIKIPRGSKLSLTAIA